MLKGRIFSAGPLKPDAHALVEKAREKMKEEVGLAVKVSDRVLLLKLAEEYVKEGSDDNQQ